MQWIDPKFHANKGRYLAQTALAVLVMFFILDTLDGPSNAAIIAALGASSFIAFTMPHANVSRPRFLIGGYAVGILSGVICRQAWLGASASQIELLNNLSIVVFATLSLGLAIFVMVVANLEHPPAAGIALGLVLNDTSGVTILVISIGIVLLTAAKTILKPLMIDLL